MAMTAHKQSVALLVHTISTIGNARDLMLTRLSATLKLELEEDLGGEMLMDNVELCARRIVSTGEGALSRWRADTHR